MSRRTFVMSPQRRAFIVACVRDTPNGCIVEIREQNRTLPQNDKMWATLTEISAQLPWQDWRGRPIRMSADEWKQFFIATLFREQRMVMGEDGASLVLVGGRSSTLTKTEMSDLIELMQAFAAQRGVTLTERGENAAERNYPNDDEEKATRGSKTPPDE